MSQMTATMPAALPTAYPVRVDAQEHPDPSRLLWLVKWAAVIPHYVVLVFLWAAFAVLSIVAFVAILITGRYPRAIFDFNVGVLRWSWRVTYYAYGALGTDRYPPFTLADDPDYPAHLTVDYPERLSRGLVLVKWWLLALPHYLVVGILLGGGAWAAERADGPVWMWGGGLIGLLALVAAIVLAFTGRYPQGVYDLVLGLNRWVLRVAAYAGLMTDEYPPFRLDSGPHEPGTGVQLMTGPAPAAPAPAAATPGVPTSGVDLGKGAPPEPARRTGWTGGRIVSVVAGTVLVLMSLGSLTAGVGTFIVNGSARDGGYVTSLDRSVSSNGYAVVVDQVVLEAAGRDSSLPARLIGDVRARVAGVGSTPVFVGIASSSAVSTYLGGVSRDVLLDMPGSRMMGNGWVRDHMDSWGPMATQPGTSPSGPPAAQGFWAEQSSGVGTQSITWRPREGTWALVVMNADGSPSVNATVDVGATVPWLPWLGGGLLALGLVLAVAGALLILVPTQRVSRERS
jgi:hypothetical protein